MCEIRVPLVGGAYVYIRRTVRQRGRFEVIKWQKRWWIVTFQNGEYVLTYLYEED